ncbi:MAG: hypothetical protein ABSA29_18825 [Terriglobales bacterium]
MHVSLGERGTANDDYQNQERRNMSHCQTLLRNMTYSKVADVTMAYATPEGDRIKQTAPLEG